MAEALPNSTSWEQAQLAPPLTDREREVRDLFVTEYLKDRNLVAAAMRTGYNSAFAHEMGTKFFNEPYVQQQIDIRKVERVKTLTPEERKELMIAAAMEIALNPMERSSARATCMKFVVETDGTSAPARKELSGPNGAPLNPTTLQVVFSDEPDEE